MQTLNCLIIEDEPLAAEILREYIKNIPGLNLAGVCGDAFSALEFLRNNKIEVLFVDINLPKVNGLDFIRSLKQNYFIVLTTAYHEYALEGYNLNVVDYLLKPIELSRFIAAVNKIFERVKPSIIPETNTEDKQRLFYFFNVDKKQVKVFADEIIYVESLKDYIRIHTPGKKIVTRFQIGELEDFLKNPVFLRIHKSYIINTTLVTTIGATEIELGEFKIPIGRSFKESAEKVLKSLKN